MTPAARISAAIEVLVDIATRRRPAADALKDWGLAHRFAGSKDRAAIASLAYDALRRRASAAWLMDDEGPRAALLGMLRLQRGLALPTIEALFSGERFAPEPLSDAERTRLGGATLADAPPAIAGDVPDWLYPDLERSLGENTIEELRALARRAPLDLRVNALRQAREPALAALPHLGAAATPFSPWGLRVPVGEDGRGPALAAEPEFLQGWYEIQDEGSQLASLLSGARAGETIVDLCAGGGGKTLAVAAMTGNAGRLVATDGDPRRLAPIHARLARAGAQVEVRTPRGRERASLLDDLNDRVDRVLVDAPCTGSGTWRRNPDAKWRLRPGGLATRLAEQAEVLDRAARLVRPGGHIAYITCSLLPQENDGAIEGAMARSGGELSPVAAEVVLSDAPAGLAEVIRRTTHGLQMTPLATGTDGFYVALLRRQ